MGKPHKHAEVIKAWADGEDIQYRMRKDREWSTVENNSQVSPAWLFDWEYRVKPKNIEMTVGVINLPGSGLFISEGVTAFAANLKVTFTPGGKLIKAEVL